MHEADAACHHLLTEHRAIENRLDRLLDALLHLTSERVSEVQAVVGELQGLAALHFRKEEEIFYPKVRPLAPELLRLLDQQHEEVRELENHMAGLLAEIPETPDGRWLNELRSFGIELHDRIQHHIVDEEDHLFRVAGERLTSEEQHTPAKAMAAVRPA